LSHRSMEFSSQKWPACRRDEVRLVPARRPISIFGRNITMARRNIFNSSTEPIEGFNSKRRTAVLIASSRGARDGLPHSLCDCARPAKKERARSALTVFFSLALPLHFCFTRPLEKPNQGSNSDHHFRRSVKSKRSNSIQNYDDPKKR
jgi:hypothetical protein